MDRRAGYERFVSLFLLQASSGCRTVRPHRHSCHSSSERCTSTSAPHFLPAGEQQLLYFETSAKANINVVQLFEEVADK